MSNCKITYSPQGKITGVKDQNGNDSTLFREIVSNPHISAEQGVDIYKQTYSDKIPKNEQTLFKSIYTVNDDLENSSTIQLNSEKGSVVIGEVYGLYDFLEEFEESFNDSDFFIEIQDIQIKPEFQGQGEGTQLLQDTIEYIESKFGNKDIYLNASPVGNKILTAQELSNFYSKEGFEVLEDEGSNITMVRNAKKTFEYKNKSAKTQDFFSDVVTGKSDKFKPNKPWTPILSFTKTEETFKKIYDKYKGKFDTHIATSIPTFRETQIKVGNAISQMYNKALVYDIGGSEGGFVKSITEKSKGNIKSINLDPNPDMQEVHEKIPVEGSEFIREAFYESFEDNGVTYKKHVPQQKADVVHESMVFQFITPERKAFVKEVAENYVKEDGIFLTEEKLLPQSEEVWRANEQNKNQHKLNYYSNEQLNQKSEEVLVGMKKNQTYQQDYINALKEHFSFVEEYWDAGNFKGIIATNSEQKLNEFLDKIGGKITSEYSSVENPSEVVEQYIERITKLKGENPEQYWSVDIPSKSVVEKANSQGRLVDINGGMGIITEDGNMEGLFKYDSNAKGSAESVHRARVKLGAIKGDNFDGYITKLSKKVGFRVVSRLAFNEELAPDGWNKEKHGTPDVVFMIYDPQGQLDIEEKSFNKDQYDEALAYRESFIEEAKKIHPYYQAQETQPTVQEPSLTYITPNKEEYPTFKEALDNTQTGDISANIGNVTLFTVDSSTDYNTVSGTINGLIKSGILTGESILDPTGEKVILTEGLGDLIKTVNWVIGQETLIKSAGRKNVKITEDGNFILGDGSTATVQIRNNQGELEQVDLNIFTNSTKEELKKQFPDVYMSAIALQTYQNFLKGTSDQQVSEEQLEFTPEAELQEALIGLLNKMGVKITSITDYITKFAKKNGVEPSASALADLTNKIVAFKNGEINIEDLSEETAHFIVETFNQEEVNNLLRNINKTAEWQEHSDNYYKLYKENNPNISDAQLEQLVRKEILGKVLANAILQNSAVENQTETQKNIFQKLRDLFIQFFEKINARFKPEYQTELESWTNKVYANLMANDLYEQLDETQLEKGRFQMYSATKKSDDPIVQINVRANKALNVIQNNINRLREGSSKSEVTQYRIALEKESEQAKIAAVSGIVSIVKRQTNYLKQVLEKNKDKNHPFSADENAVYTNTVGTMLGYMAEIKELLNDKDKDHVKLKEEISKLNETILEIKGSSNILSDNGWRNMVEEQATKLSLTEQEKQELLDAYIERTDENGNKVGGQGKKDTNWFFAHIAPMVHAQDPALNMASSVISKMTMKHSMAITHRVKSLFEKMEDLGIEQPNKLFKSWKRGNYLFGPIKQQLLDEEVLSEKTKIYNELKGTKLTEKEFEEQKANGQLGLTAQEQSEFDEKVNIFRRENHYVDYLTKKARAEREKLYEGLSKEAVRFDRNLSRDRGIIGEEARKLNTYTQEHKYRLQQINKERIKKESPYYDGNLKQGLLEKDGEIIKDPSFKNIPEESQMVLDLQELKKRKLEFFKEKNQDTKVIPQKFKNILGNQTSAEAQLEYLMLNANISFSNEFWDSLSENDNIVQRLEPQTNNPIVSELINRIKILQKKRTLILKANRVHNLPSEIDFSELSGHEMDAVKDISEQLQQAYSEAREFLPEKIDDENITPFSSNVNEAYKAEVKQRNLSESKEKEFNFIKEHVTNKDKYSLDKLGVKARDIIEGREPRLNDFYKEIFQDNYVGSPEEIKEQVYSDVVEHAKTKLLPYFKRIEPNQGESFSSIMEQLNNGSKTAVQFVSEVENGVHPQISLTPNYIFFDQENNEDLNPEYQKNEELGLPQIQSQYRDSEFQKHFGFDYNTAQPQTNKNEYEAWKALTDFHNETLEATDMTERHNEYLLPQRGVRGARQFHKLLTGANKLDTLKEIWKDFTSYREDEKEYGENASGQVLGGKEGDLRIPKYGFNRLSNEDDVTDELLESYIWMASEAELYKARVEAFADMESIKNLITNSSYSDKAGEKSRVYQMFDSFYRYNIYGQNEEFSYETDLFGILPKKQNLAPLAKKFQFWVRLVNLGFNLIVPLTSILQGGVNLTIERFVGERVDKDASKLAKRYLAKHMGKAVGDTLALNSKSRLSSVGEYLGVFDITDRFRDSNYGKLSRGMLRSGFITHTIADAPIKWQVMMTVLKDMRVVDGDIINYNTFKKQKMALAKSAGETLTDKKIRGEWSKYEENTFDNYLVTEKGTTDIEVEKLLEDLNREGDTDVNKFIGSKLQFIRDTIKRTAQEVDTMIPTEERSFAQRHAIFSFFFLHRGWMSVAYNRKFKNKHLNTHTGLKEEGNWWGTADFIKGWVNEWKNPENSKTFLKTVKDEWDKADDTRKRSINRTLIELAMTNSLAVLSLILMGMADDDEENGESTFAQQFGSYMGYRASNEVISSTVSYPSQVWDMLANPIIGLDKLKSAADIMDIFSGEEVTRGKYAGQTERMRFIYKNLPLAREYNAINRMESTRKIYKFYNQKNFENPFIMSSYFLSQED